MGPRYDEKYKRYRVRIESRGEVVVDKSFCERQYKSKEECKAAADACYKAAMILKHQKVLYVKKPGTFREEMVGVRRTSGKRVCYVAQVGSEQISFTVRKDHVNDPYHELRAFQAAHTCRYVYTICEDEGAIFDRELFKNWRDYPILSPGMFRLRQDSSGGDVRLVMSDRYSGMRFDAGSCIERTATTGRPIQIPTMLSKDQIVSHQKLTEQLRSDLLKLEGSSL